MWFPKIKKIQKLNLLKSGLNGGQKGILFFVHVNMNVSRIILILVANWQEIFGEWLINPRPKTESSEVTLQYVDLSIKWHSTFVIHATYWTRISICKKNENLAIGRRWLNSLMIKLQWQKETAYDADGPNYPTLVCMTVEFRGITIVIHNATAARRFSLPHLCGHVQSRWILRQEN